MKFWPWRPKRRAEMRIKDFYFKFILFLVAQIIVWVYFNFSQFLMIAILPAMILAIPVRHGTILSMIIAFFLGFLVDFLTSGMLGLTSLALVAVAFVRIPILRLAFGNELFSRGGNISTENSGYMKTFFGILLATLVFVLIYVWADGAGTRPFWFNAVKVLISLVASTLISIPVVNFLSDNGK